MRSFMAYKELWLVFVSNHSARACLRARKIKPLSPLTKILNRVISGLWTRNEMESWINALLKSAFSLLFMLKHHFCDTSTIFVCRNPPEELKTLQDEALWLRSRALPGDLHGYRFDWQWRIVNAIVWNHH